MCWQRGALRISAYLKRKSHGKCLRHLERLLKVPRLAAAIAAPPRCASTATRCVAAALAEHALRAVMNLSRDDRASPSSPQAVQVRCGAPFCAVSRGPVWVSTALVCAASIVAMGSLPQGTVTFLFSDIEGSTRLARRFGDPQWVELLEAHRSLLRAEFRAHAGMEVDAQGDAFFAVFARATEAVACAVAVQRAMLSHDWPADALMRVRIGLHTGEAVLRDGHYIGQEVHRASRICEAGHGGQIVLSQPTAELVRAVLPNDLTLLDLGEHRLNGLSHSHRLFQLSAPGLNAVFPPLRGVNPPTNLPVARSSFVGRDREIAMLQGALAEHRLVTLIGIGGAGKTRLAAQVAAMELPAFPDGVFFVDLAPVAGAELIAQTLAAACGLVPGDSPAGARTLVDRLIAALAARRSLLLVDNCEHLLAATAILVDQILTGCAQVVVLATSREGLGVDGEQIIQVPSLDVPGASATGEVSDAMRLFADRAHAVSSSFQLDTSTAASVAEICRRLDGIPLAIEFAAARVAHLSLQQIAGRLEERFSLLTGGRRRIQRQQTMSASLDWSHDLLSIEEKVIFRRIAVFVGGFSLSAAEAVCGGDGVSAGVVLNMLGSLAAKSFLTVGQGESGDTRYRLLETVRLYALRNLQSAGEEETFRARHRDHYLAWLESTPLERLVFEAESIEAVSSEIDNLRSAADWCLVQDRPDLGSRIVTRMFGYWTTHLSYQIPKGMMEWALTQEERLSTDERVESHTLLGWIFLVRGEFQKAVTETTHAVDLSVDLVDPFPVLAQTLRAFGIAILASISGNDPALIAESRRGAEAAMAAARYGFPPAWRAHAELFRAYIELQVNNSEGAAQWFGACAQSCRSAKLQGWLLPAALAGLAASLHLLGRTGESVEAALSFLALNDALGVTWGNDQAIEVAPALFAGGQPRRAEHELYQRAAIMRRNGVDLAPNHFLGMAAVIEFQRGHPERAARLLGAARSLGGADTEVLGFRTTTSQAYYVHYRKLVHAALGPDEAMHLRNEGRAMTLDEAFSYALQELPPTGAS